MANTTSKGSKCPDISEPMWLSLLSETVKSQTVASEAEEIDIDDILKKDQRKKSINSGRKGKSREREASKVLNKRFMDLLSQHADWGGFSRSIGSGNRWGQGVSLSKTAADTFAGDLSVPTNFKFVIESKGGYNDVDLNSAFEGGHTQIDEFIEQVSADSQRCGRKPLIIWKKDRKPAVAILRAGEVPATVEDTWQYVMRYRDWRIYLLADVLTLPDDFFFKLA